MQRAVLIVAGGTGTRMGSAQPKQFLPLGEKPVIIETLNRFLEWDPEIIPAIVIYPDAREKLEEILNTYLPEEIRNRIILAEGGDTRCISVWNGVQALYHTLSQPETWLAVHDAVRPILSPALLENNFNTAVQKGNAVCCVPVKSSLRKISAEGSESVDRSLYLHVQTPQTFRLSELYGWMKNRPHDAFTDEASLAEASGACIYISEGSYDNLKITTPEDLIVARYLHAHPDFTPE